MVHLVMGIGSRLIPLRYSKFTEILHHIRKVDDILQRHNLRSGIKTFPRIKKQLVLGIGLSLIWAISTIFGKGGVGSGFILKLTQLYGWFLPISWIVIQIRKGRNSGLVMDRAKPEEAEEIFDFLVEYYFPFPPFRQIHFYDEKKPETCRPAWRLDEIHQYLAAPYALIIRDENKSSNQIVGITVNNIEDKKDFKPPEMQEPDTSIGWLDRALCDELNRGLDLFSYFGTDRILHLSSGLVRPDHRGSGLLFQMIKVATDLAYYEGGAGAAKGDSFSRYAIQSALNAGFEVIRSIDFATLEVNGTRPMAHFTGMGEFCTASLIASRLPLSKIC